VNHDWQIDMCPECGEETYTGRGSARSLGTITVCRHCLWSNVDNKLANLTKHNYPLGYYDGVADGKCSDPRCYSESRPGNGVKDGISYLPVYEEEDVEDE